MKNLASFALILLVQSVAGIIVPNGHPEGLFTTPMDPRHENYGTFHSLGRRASPPPPVRYSRRGMLGARDLPINNKGCGSTDVVMHADDYAQAQTGLGVDCAQALQPNHAMIFIGGNTTVLYVCNYGGDNHCSSDEIGQAMAVIDSNCGSLKSGWVEMDSWAKGYGRAGPMETICADNKLPFQR